MEVSSLKRLLVSGYLWAFSGRMITAIFGMVVNILLTRLLEPAEVGSYFLIVSIVTVLSMFCMFGQQRVIVRIVPDAIARGFGGMARQGVINAFFIMLLITFAVVSIMMVVGPMLTAMFFDSMIMSNVIFFAVALLIVRTLSSMFAETFRAFHNIRNAVLFNGTLVNVGFAAVLFILYISSEKYTLQYVLILSICTYAINFLVSWALSRRLFDGLDHKGSISKKELLKIGGPLLITGLTLFTITQADLWVVGYVLDEKQVALYGAAVKFVQLIVIPLMIMNAVLPSIISDLYARGDLKLLEKVLRTSALVAGVPAFVVLAVVMFASADILVLMFGEYYGAASNVLLIVSAGQVVNVFSGASLMVLMMSGLQLYAMTISIVSGFFLVTAGLYATREFGLEGMATVVSVTVALQAIVVLLVVRVKIGIWTHVGFGNVPALIMQFNKVRARR